ncbi:MAG TPA: peptidoglycan-associated lipoprotein Pal [Nitrospirota bacterium]
MKLFRYMLMLVAVAGLVMGGMYGCAKKAEKAGEGVQTTMPSETGAEAAGKTGAEGDRTVTEAPPGGEQKAEPVEPARAEQALKDVYFDLDSFEITPSQTSVLEENSKWMKANKDAIVTIEGHCDERGTVEYNLSLGEKRANVAKDYLVSLGVDSSSIKTISLGKSKPADPGHDEAAWAKNRRDHFVVQ